MREAYREKKYQNTLRIRFFEFTKIFIFDEKFIHQENLKVQFGLYINNYRHANLDQFDGDV